MRHSEGLTREAIIVNELGLHARAAGKLAVIAGQARFKVWVERKGVQCDAKSMIDILTLACGKGSKISVKIEDPSDRDVLVAMVELINNGFEE